MISSPEIRERAHILEKYIFIVKKISLLYIKWDFFPCLKWARNIPIISCTVKLGYIKLGFCEYMVYIEVLSRSEHNPIYFHVK